MTSYEIKINDKDCIFQFILESPFGITIFSTHPERKKDGCHCNVLKNGDIRYFGKENWQNSEIIKNPKFPQEVPADIALNEDDYKEAMRIIKEHPIQAFRYVRAK